MKRLKTLFLVSFLLIFNFNAAKSQQMLSDAELEILLDKAEIQSQKYGIVFQNLSAEELKTKSFYKSDGNLDEKRVTKSLFVVYQSPNGAQEFRNVLEFNGKNVQRSDKEIAEFFEKLAKKNSTQEEYEKLRKESLRFDGPKNAWGTTLTQSRPYRTNMRGSFKFKVVGKERIEGREVWVIEYEQFKVSPQILSNPTKEELKLGQGSIQYNTPLSDDFRPTNPLLKGKLWLDAETAQMFCNEFKVYLNPKNLSKPAVAEELIYEYQTSNFGILVPKRIWMLVYNIKGKDDKSLSIKKDIELDYEYSKFSEFKSETKDYKLNEK